MEDSAQSKINRARKHIAEIGHLLREKRPFAYILETNVRTGERTTFAKKNVPVIAEIAGIAGDTVHNLRSALDHAYWEIVSPVATSDGDRKAIQFPFSETAARLKETIQTRLAHKVSDIFFHAILSLKPHGEVGGNESLWLIHKLDTIDKHRFPIPTGDYTRIDSDLVRAQAPDFPAGITNAVFGGNNRDVTWRAANIDRTTLGNIVAPTMYKFQKELDVPVDVTMAFSNPNNRRPMIPTLRMMVDVTRQAILTMRAAAN